MEIKKVTNGIKHYLVDTTGLLLASTPIYAAMETIASGMSVATSFESRLKVAGLAYCGLGITYAKGRDLSKKIFKINKDSSEGKHTVHDSIYNAAFNIALSIPIYLSSGADLEQAVKGATGATILGLISGPINGYSIDSFRDFAGTKELNREMPKFFKNANKKVKKLFAVGMVVGMVAGTTGVYSIKNKYFPNFPKQEQKIEIENSSLEKIILKSQP